MNSLMLLLPMLMGKKFDMSSLGPMFQQMAPSQVNTGTEGNEDMSRLFSNPLLMSMLSGKNKEAKQTPPEESVPTFGFTPIEQIAGFQVTAMLFTLMKYGK